MKKNFILLKTDSLDNYIITEVLEETEDQILVNYPVVIRLISDFNSGTVGVQTSKVMPFSINNVVAYSKESIVAMSKPSEVIVKHYLNFIEKHSQAFDTILENELLGDNEGYREELFEPEEELEIVTPTNVSSNTILH